MIEEKTRVPNFRETRALLLDLRAKHGAETAIGRCCSNLLEQTENYSKATDSETKIHLAAAIARSNTDLNKLVSQSR